MNCIFCTIIAKEIAVAAIAENETILVIKDIAPKAPIHYLIIPKKHVENINALTPADASIASEMLMMAQHVSHTLLESADFRLIFNTGANAGQSVFHMHAHFLAGKSMTDF